MNITESKTNIVDRNTFTIFLKINQKIEDYG